MTGPLPFTGTLLSHSPSEVEWLRRRDRAAVIPISAWGSELPCPPEIHYRGSERDFSVYDPARTQRSAVHWAGELPRATRADVDITHNAPDRRLFVGFLPVSP